jgi:hypothetical protein
MERTTALGWSWSEGKREWQLARIADEDRRQHLYVSRATGSGKTKFSSFPDPPGPGRRRGVGVIDPHGDLIEALKGLLAAVARQRGGEAFPGSGCPRRSCDPVPERTFSTRSKRRGDRPRRAGGRADRLLPEDLADSWGVRMEDLLRNSLLTLSARASRWWSCRRPNDADVPRGRPPAAHTSIARAYFDRFERLSDRAQLAWSEPVLNKLGALLAPRSRAPAPRRPGKHLRPTPVMDCGQVLLIKLDKGRLKDGADLLAPHLLAKLQLAAFSRSDMPVDRRRPFTLYVDEFQNFATRSFGILLSEARKYGLSLVLAHPRHWPRSPRAAEPDPGQHRDPGRLPGQPPRR